VNVPGQGQVADLGEVVLVELEQVRRHRFVLFGDGDQFDVHGARCSPNATARATGSFA
jgi:hypothetical protein